MGDWGLRRWQLDTAVTRVVFCFSFWAPQSPIPTCRKWIRTPPNPTITLTSTTLAKVYRCQYRGSNPIPIPIPIPIPMLLDISLRLCNCKCMLIPLSRSLTVTPSPTPIAIPSFPIPLLYMGLKPLRGLATMKLEVNMDWDRHRHHSHRTPFHPPPPPLVPPPPRSHR